MRFFPNKLKPFFEVVSKHFFEVLKFAKSKQKDKEVDRRSLE
jgi:hypothetical protein